MTIHQIEVFTYTALGIGAIGMGYVGVKLILGIQSDINKKNQKKLSGRRPKGLGIHIPYSLKTCGSYLPGAYPCEFLR